MTRTGDPMDDDQFDHLLREAARSYNEPPPVPVEAMWAAIQAKRSGQTAPSLVVSAPAGVPGARVRRFGGAWRLSALAAAALLLLSAGIGIGRLWERGPGSTPERVAADVPPGSPRDGGTAETGGAPGERGRTEAEDRTEVGTTREAVPAPRGRDYATASERAAPRRPADLSPRRETAAPESNVAPYGTLAAQHLAQAEALLTTFRAAPPDAGDAAADAAVWARDLLGTTRLLLDSPAARDPERRRLLEDLELVLVQLARLPQENGAEERALIDRTIRRRDVLTKLRAGSVLQGT